MATTGATTRRHIQPEGPEFCEAAKNLSRVGKYFLSSKGRNLVGGVAVLGSSVYFGGYILMNSWLLPYYRDAVQLYK